MTNFDLNDIVIEPKSGVVRRIVVLLHGYGADNALFKDIGEFFAENISDAVIHIPNGLEECESGVGGRQWFPLEGGVNYWQSEMSKASIRFNIYLDNLLVKYQLKDEDLILSGFSQGAMMSLQCGLERHVKAIIGFSGTLVDSSVLDKITSVPNVLLIHGDADAVLPVASVYEAADAFKNRDFSVKLAIIPRLEHYIDVRALDAAKAFIKELGLDN